MNNKILIILLLAGCNLITVSSCKKSGVSALPKATQKGANTFGCLINGAVFITHDVYSYPTDSGLLASYNESTKEFRISTTEQRNENQNGLQRETYLDLTNPHVGVNNFNENNYGQIIIGVNYQQDQYYQTTDSIGGTMNITKFDTNLKIISGTFSFDASAKFNATGILHVTNGRFDITYK